MQIKAALVDAVRNRQAVLFAGAGISWKAIGYGGLHIRDQMGMQIKRDYPSYDYEQRSFEDVCDEYVALDGAQELVHILSEAYGIVPATKLFVGNELELTHFGI